MISLYHQHELETFRKEHGIDPFHLRRLFYRHFIDSVAAAKALQELPVQHRESVAANVRFHELRLQERQDSDVDGATKILFQTHQGARLETVILRAPNRRVSVCVSSQVGCAAGCRFCATTLIPQVTNLSCGEIVDQIVQANQQLTVEQKRIRNVVFMGMGEPLHNFEQVAAALELCHHQHALGLAARRTVVSTVGIPEAMIAFAERFTRVPLALSLHSTDQVTREKLIPLAKKYHLTELRRAVKEVNRLQRQPVLIEYLMLDSVNDSLTDADHLANYLNDLQVMVNLIPYNPIPARPDLQPTPRDRRDAFAMRLREQGLTVTIRYSQGTDIDAACGQLAGQT